jgi:hypothetical protein
MVPPIKNGMSMKKKSTLVYPNIPSAIRPVPHGDGLPVPELPDNLLFFFFLFVPIHYFITPEIS